MDKETTNYFQEYLIFLENKKLILGKDRKNTRGAFGSHIDEFSANTIINEIKQWRTFERNLHMLEIGTHHGFSMGIFQLNIPALELITIDIYKYEGSEKILKVLPNSKPILLPGNVNVLQKINKKFDVVYIDGNHYYEGCKNDWNSIQPYLADKALIFLHDIGYRAHGDLVSGPTTVYNEITKPKKLFNNGRENCLGMIYHEKY